MADLRHNETVLEADVMTVSETAPVLDKHRGGGFEGSLGSRNYSKPRPKRKTTPAEVRAKHREIARRYAWREEPRPKLPKWQLVGRKRLKEFEWLMERRYGRFLPDDDAGRDDVLIAANLLMVLGKPISGWICRYAPWMPPDEAEAVIEQVTTEPERFTAASLGKRIRLTEEERVEGRITAIRSFDATLKKMRARRRERRRLAEQDRRRRKAEAEGREYQPRGLSMESKREAGRERIRRYRASLSPEQRERERQQQRQRMADLRATRRALEDGVRNAIRGPERNAIRGLCVTVRNGIRGQLTSLREGGHASRPHAAERLQRGYPTVEVGEGPEQGNDRRPSFKTGKEEKVTDQGMGAGGPPTWGGGTDGTRGSTVGRPLNGPSQSTEPTMGQPKPSRPVSDPFHRAILAAIYGPSGGDQ